MLKMCFPEKKNTYNDVYISLITELGELVMCKHYDPTTWMNS